MDNTKRLLLVAGALLLGCEGSEYQMGREHDRDTEIDHIANDPPSKRTICKQRVEERYQTCLQGCYPDGVENRACVHACIVDDNERDTRCNHL